MARRVGSPKALVMALTAAENSPGADVGSLRSASRAGEVGAAVATPVFYLSP